ncbi:type VII secretion protein EccB [Actinomyces viscosus]|uniref:Type VII secretion protein EccB n=1 Tax=Actinomyces viscosus TaxID=1656 RepID=A0A448PMS8_ACTVI|nr:type VII secretion protein EccB [Actinomyces viscosus]TFH52414.1 type VII secretion protein EccB [Actinomyces viscosus]VEI17205.1 type VII secretion protein EccB [Actinomyces viscosus]
MASNKDILNAQRFNRQRLIMAFSAGTPEGRELEPRNMLRPVLGGIAVALVILLVSLVMGRFTSPLPNEWQNNTLVVVKGEGTRYVTIRGRLRPITNIASARLLSDPGSFKETTTGADALDGIERGSQVGIADAPESLPAAKSLVSRGWAACSSTSGATSTHVGSAPSGMGAVGHALVSVDGSYYLIANGSRYPIPSENRDAILLALGLDSDPVLAVDATWINLFSQGSTIQPFSLPDAGTSVSTLSSSISNPTAGSLLAVSDGSGAQRHYLVRADGRVARLNEVELAMYQLGAPGVSEQQVNASDLSQVSTTSSSAPTDWPDTLGKGVSENQSACAVLQVNASGQATSTISASNQIENGGVTVKGGKGALVRATSGGSAGQIFLLTDAGRVWALGGTTADTVKQLGYTMSNVSDIPSPWVSLFPAGPELSKAAVWKDVADK